MKERFKNWLLLSGNRYSIAIVILAIMTGVVLLPAFSRFHIRNISPLWYIASALIGGNITLITVVVAINQVVLSQELESPGSIRDEIERTADYRAEALDQSAPPVEPADFLRLLLQKTAEDARSLDGLLSNTSDGITDRLLNELPEHCEHCGDQLESSSNKLSSVIVPLLGTDYAVFIRDCYKIQSEQENEDDEQLRERLDTLTSDLENLNIAQQYFTTAFMKEELATLSRVLAYVGILAVSLPLALLYQLTTYPTASPPMVGLYLLTLCTVVVGLLPLALLIAFIVRVASITHYTAVITPFRA